MGLDQLVEKVVNILSTDDDIKLSESGISIKSEDSVVTRIVEKNSTKQIVSGPVLVPGEADNSGDIVSKNKIEDLAYSYLRKYGNVDKQHQLANKAEVVESYITPTELSYKVDGEDVNVPEGSWWLSVKVTDEETWQQVENGELNGFSIMAVNKGESSEKSSLDTAKKGFNIVNLADLDNDYEVNYVSLVDAPDVPKARFASIKNCSQKSEDKEISTVTKYAELSDTLEDRLDKRKNSVKEAVESTFIDVIYVWVLGLFEDSVVVEAETEDDIDYYKIPYSYDIENDVAEVTGEAEKVEIKKVVSTKAKTVSKAINTVDHYQELVKKEGKVISEVNKSKLKKAKEELTEALSSIDELLQISTKTKEEEEMDKEEIQQVVKSTLDEVDLEATIKEEVSKILDEKEIEDETDGKANEQEVEEIEEDSHEDEIDEEKLSREELEEKVEELEAKISPKSKSIDGQDTVVKSDDGASQSMNEYLGRDVMGRKLKE